MRVEKDSLPSTNQCIVLLEMVRARRNSEETLEHLPGTSIGLRCKSGKVVYTLKSPRTTFPGAYVCTQDLVVSRCRLV